MTPGYNQPLYVLPFDHRATFAMTMLGWSGPLNPDQVAKIAEVKQVIYDAFQTAVAGGVPRARAGILVDEEFGAAILRDARERGFVTACPAAGRRRRAGRVEDRGQRPEGGLSAGGRRRAPRRTGAGRVHHPRPWRGRPQGAAVADDRGRRARLHRLHSRPDHLLGATDRLPRRRLPREAAGAQIATSYRA
jgi:hypothetical protein